MKWTDRQCYLNLDEAEVENILRSSPTVVALTGSEFARISLDRDSIKFSKVVGVGEASSFRILLAQHLPAFKQWLSTHEDLRLGYFSYELKNSLEQLESSHPDLHMFSAAYFFIPEHVFVCTDNGWRCYSHGALPVPDAPPAICDKRLGLPLSALDKGNYVRKVHRLKQHIQQGDVYEVNFCVQQGFANSKLDPFRLFQELESISPAPFSCYVADGGQYLMSASPERFMRKEGQKVIAQPMKGTNRRMEKNELQMMALQNDPKERAENIMITDLVRNDLSRTAKKGSVTVEECCGVYVFEQVNQMISTVSSVLRDDVHPADAIFQAFPMGSMTGAPKVRAMQLIDLHEDFSRGLYSGAVGYFTPDLDFDFNVVIRSILYNAENGAVTFPTGSAITINSDPEKEYDECQLKAEAMRNVLLAHAR